MGLFFQFLLLFLMLGSASVAGQCVVISGIPEDREGVFDEYKNKLSDCKVYRNFDELVAARFKFETIELHVVSHGRKDGATICSKTEPPSEIVEKLNQVSQSNKVFVAFDSCYSDQIIKERILFDRKQPIEKNNLLKNTCMYSASTANNEALISMNGKNESTFAEFKFLQKGKVNGKKIVDLYSDTTTGLLSGAPFDSAGVTDYWAGLNSEVTAKKMSKLLEILDGNKLSSSKCLALEMSKKISAPDFFTLSRSLYSMKVGQKMLSWKSDQTTDYVRSYEKLAKAKSGKAFLSFLELADTPSFLDFKKACKEVSAELKDELFCSLKAVNSADFQMLQSLYKIKQVMDAIQGEAVSSVGYSIFPDETDPQQLENALLSQLKNKKINQFNSQSFVSMMGDASGPDQFIGLDGSDSVSWGSVLGTFCRLSVASALKGGLVPSTQLDQQRLAACSKFSYDRQGSLKFIESMK